MAIRPPIITPGRETSSDAVPPRLQAGVNTWDGRGIIEAMDLSAAGPICWARCATCGFGPAGGDVDDRDLVAVRPRPRCRPRARPGRPPRTGAPRRPTAPGPDWDLGLQQRPGGLVCERPLERQLPAAHAQPAVQVPADMAINARAASSLASRSPNHTHTARSAPVRPSPGATRFRPARRALASSTAAPPQRRSRRTSGFGALACRFHDRGFQRRGEHLAGVVALPPVVAHSSRRCGLGRLVRTPVSRGDRLGSPRCRWLIVSAL